MSWRRFITVLSLFLLTLWPGRISASNQPNGWTTGAIRQAAADRALSWVRSQQRDDGALGAYGPSITLTADAIYAVALSGDDPAGSEWTPQDTSLLAALRSLAETQASDAGRVGKALRALGAAGYDASDPTVSALITKLNGWYDPTTGAYGPYPDQGFHQALAIEGLAAVGAPIPDAAINRVLSKQHSDGGWSWQFGNASAESDVDTTGQVMLALLASGMAPDHEAITRAMAFLAAMQQEDGGWPDVSSATVTNGNSSGLAVRAAIRAGLDPRAAPLRAVSPTAEDYLLNLQQSSGAFTWRPDQPADNLMATLDILPALIPAWPGDRPLSYVSCLPAVIRR